MSDAFPRRSDWRKDQTKCNGNCKNEFRQKGGIFFCFLNVLQLVGWTAIMIYDGALAADGVIHTGRWDLVSGDRCTDHSVDCDWNHESWQDQYGCNGSIIYPDTGTLQSDLHGERIGGYASSDEAMTFGAAVELSVAMPLSWLPLISDYTAKQKSR